MFAKIIFTKGTCTRNYNTFYVEGQQDLRPLNKLIPYGYALCAGSSHAAGEKYFYISSNNENLIISESF